MEWWIRRAKKPLVNELRETIVKKARIVFLGEEQFNEFRTALSKKDNLVNVLALIKNTNVDVGDKSFLLTHNEVELWCVTQNKLLLINLVEYYYALLTPGPLSNVGSIFSLLQAQMPFGRIYLDVDFLPGKMVDSEVEWNTIATTLCRELQGIIGIGMTINITRASEEANSFHLISSHNFDMVTKHEIEKKFAEKANQLYDGCLKVDFCILYCLSPSKHMLTNVYTNGSLNPVRWSSFPPDNFLKCLPVELDESGIVYTKLRGLVAHMNEECDNYICNPVVDPETDQTRMVKTPLSFVVEGKPILIQNLSIQKPNRYLMLNKKKIQMTTFEEAMQMCRVFKMAGETASCDSTFSTYSDGGVKRQSVEPYDLFFHTDIKFTKSIKDILSDFDSRKVHQSIVGDPDDMDSINQVQSAESLTEEDIKEFLKKKWPGDFKNVFLKCNSRGEFMNPDKHNLAIKGIVTFLRSSIKNETLFAMCKRRLGAKSDEDFAEKLVCKFVLEGHYTTALSLVLQHAIWRGQQVYNGISFIYRLLGRAGIPKLDFYNAIVVYSTMLESVEYAVALKKALVNVFRPHVVYLLFNNDYSATTNVHDRFDLFERDFKKAYAEFHPDKGPDAMGSAEDDDDDDATTAYDDTNMYPFKKTAKKGKKRKKRETASEVAAKRAKVAGKGKRKGPSVEQALFGKHLLCIKRKSNLNYYYNNGRYIEFPPDSDIHTYYPQDEQDSFTEFPLEVLTCRYWFATFYGVYHPIFGIEPATPSFLTRLYVTQFGERIDLLKYRDFKFKNVILDLYLKSKHFIDFLMMHKTSTLALGNLLKDSRNLIWEPCTSEIDLISADFKRCMVAPELAADLKNHPALHQLFKWVFALVCEYSETISLDLEHTIGFIELFSQPPNMSINLECDSTTSAHEYAIVDSLEKIDNDVVNFMEYITSELDGMRPNDVVHTSAVQLSSTNYVNCKVNGRKGGVIDLDGYNKKLDEKMSVNVEDIDSQLFTNVLMACSWIIRRKTPGLFKDTAFYKYVDSVSEECFSDLKTLFVKHHGPLFLSNMSSAHLALLFREYCINSQVTAKKDFNIPLPRNYSLLVKNDYTDFDLYCGMSTIIAHTQFNQEMFIEMLKDFMSFTFCTNFGRKTPIYIGQPATAKNGLVACLMAAFQTDLSQNITNTIVECENGVKGNSLTQFFNESLFLYADEVKNLNLTFNTMSDQCTLTFSRLFNDAKIESTVNAHLLLLCNKTPGIPNIAGVSRLRAYNRDYVYVDYSPHFVRPPPGQEEVQTVAIKQINDNLAYQLIMKALPTKGDATIGHRGFAQVLWHFNDFFFANLRRPITLIHTDQIETDMKLVTKNVSPTEILVRKKMIKDSATPIPLETFIEKAMNIICRELNMQKSTHLQSSVQLDCGKMFGTFIHNGYIYLDIKENNSACVL